MTTRDKLNSTYTQKDAYGILYGTYDRKRQQGANYSSLERLGQPHPYNVTIERNIIPLVTSVNKITKVTKTESALPYSPSFKTIDANLLYIKALNKLYGEVKGADFNAAISSAEMNDTIKMMGDNIRRIAKAFSSARKGDYRSAYKALAMKASTPGKNAASFWLEIQYGILPLMKDIQEAVKFIQHRMLDPVIPRYRVRTGGRADGKASPSAPTFASQTHSAGCQLIFYPTASLSITEALGLTEYDLYSVVWEKVSYSFVIDWILPIGPWLEAMTAARTLKGYVIRTDTTRRYASGLVETPFLSFTGGGGSVDRRTITVARIVGLPTPPALPTFNPLEKAASVRHVLNGVALLANLKR